ncbi:MAG: hypothetical protein KBD78_10000 [Oligoflexales bacterium]|nr:hypothetical protein [Oligoflexales bacterium]
MGKILWKYSTPILGSLYLVYLFFIVFYFKNPHMYEGAGKAQQIVFHVLGFLIIASAHAKVGYDIVHWYTKQRKT